MRQTAWVSLALYGITSLHASVVAWIALREAKGRARVTADAWAEAASQLNLQHEATRVAEPEPSEVPLPALVLEGLPRLAVAEEAVRENANDEEPASQEDSAAPSIPWALLPDSTPVMKRTIDDLFDGSLDDYDVASETPIDWWGTVAGIHRWRGEDKSFGKGPGLKIVVIVGALDDTSVFADEVFAIVQLPPETPVQSGELVTFIGTLLYVDRRTRKAYVADGTLI